MNNAVYRNIKRQSFFCKVSFRISDCHCSCIISNILRIRIWIIFYIYLRSRFIQNKYFICSWILVFIYNTFILISSNICYMWNYFVCSISFKSKRANIFICFFRNHFTCCDSLFCFFFNIFQRNILDNAVYRNIKRQSFFYKVSFYISNCHCSTRTLNILIIRIYIILYCYLRINNVYFYCF